MFSHSRASHFNRRNPTSGPPPTRHHDSSHSKAMEVPPSGSKHVAEHTDPLFKRPIVSNSRLRQEGDYKKDLYLVFVRNALQQKTMGNSDQFDELVSQFNYDNKEQFAPPSQLRHWLTALSHVVSSLERTHAALPEAIIALPWTAMDSVLVKAYASFIGILISARPEYLRVVLAKSVHGLVYQSGLRSLDQSASNGSGPLTRRTVYDRLHFLLQDLIRLVPTLPSTLLPLLVQNFPHKRQNKITHLTYIRNLLRVIEYCPELTNDVLATIIDRAIQIDVEVQVEIEEIEANGPPEPEGVFVLDPFDTVVGENDVDSESGSEDDGLGDISDLSSEAEDPDDFDNKKSALDMATDYAHVQDMVTKLDAILKLLFDHFSRSQVENGDLSPAPSSVDLFVSRPSLPSSHFDELRRSQFLTLLTIFDRTILRTFKSRYTQFLVFWYSSLDPEFTDLFQGMLLSKALLEAEQPSVTRAAATSYIASFVSRATFVGEESTRKVTALLCESMVNHLDLVEASLAPGSAAPLMASSHHTVFYAVAQAVFLIFCFRWRDLLLVKEVDEDMDDFSAIIPEASGAKRRWISELDVIHRAVKSPLNPLKTCSQNVVNQFARVARHTGFLYCYSMMDPSRHSEPIPSATESDTSRRVSMPSNPPPTFLWADKEAELHSFFPFDPYRLPLSASYVDGVYREWSSVAIDDEDDDDESDGDADEGDDTVAGQLGKSFGGMSISPERPHMIRLGT